MGTIPATGGVSRNMSGPRHENITLETFNLEHFILAFRAFLVFLLLSFIFKKKGSESKVKINNHLLKPPSN